MKKLALAMVLLIPQTFTKQSPPPSKDQVIWQAVKLPKGNFDQHFYCGAPAYTPLCGTLGEMVGLHTAAVDAILAKYKVEVFDKNGVKIFPHP